MVKQILIDLSLRETIEMQQLLLHSQRIPDLL